MKLSSTAQVCAALAARLTATLFAAVTSSCPVRELQAQIGETRSRIQHIREAIAEYALAKGRLPETLQEICPDRTPCGLMPPSNDRQGLRDGWGRPFVYNPVNGEYEVRSIGPDGSPGTSDDLVFRPSSERSRALSLAGCYKLDLGLWEEFPGRVFVLDTAVLAPGVFVLRPVPKQYDQASWGVRSQDSVLLELAEIHSIVRIRFRQLGDSLVGAAERLQRGPSKVVAHRTKCPDTSP